MAARKKVGPRLIRRTPTATKVAHRKALVLGACARVAQRESCRPTASCYSPEVVDRSSRKVPGISTGRRVCGDKHTCVSSATSAFSSLT